MRKITTLAVLLAAFTFCTSALAYAEGNAVISEVKGKAVVDRAGQSSPAVAGATLEKGDILRTEEGAQADVSMNGLAGFRLLASSDMTLEETEKTDMKLKIVKGNVILNLQKLPKDTAFAMDTPSAVAAVRGTQFWGRVDAPTPDTSVTTLAVREGTVAVTVKSSGEIFMIQEGQALDIPVGVSTAAIRKALDAEMAAMAQASDISTAI